MIIAFPSLMYLCTSTSTSPILAVLGSVTEPHTFFLFFSRRDNLPKCRLLNAGAKKRKSGGLGKGSDSEKSLFSLAV